MWTKSLVGAAVVVGLSLATPGAAIADTQSPRSGLYHVVCGDQSFEVRSPAGPSAVGQVVGTNMVSVLLVHGAPGATLTNCDVFMQGELIFTADLLLTPQRR
jgi:hypothetical protein